MTEEERSALVAHRMERARETMKEVPALLELGYHHTAVNRLYYACYYATIALLVKNHIKAQTHSGVRKMLGLHFVKTGLLNEQLGKFYSAIFDKRMTGDYEDFTNFSKEQIEDMSASTEAYLQQIEFLLKQP